MSHKIAQHVHVFSVSQDNAADTKERMYIITRPNAEQFVFDQFINFVCDTGGQRQPHANSPQPPPHTVTSR